MKLPMKLPMKHLQSTKTIHGSNLGNLVRVQLLMQNIIVRPHLSRHRPCLSLLSARSSRNISRPDSQIWVLLILIAKPRIAYQPMTGETAGAEVDHYATSTPYFICSRVSHWGCVTFGWSDACFPQASRTITNANMWFKTWLSALN